MRLRRATAPEPPPPAPAFDRSLDHPVRQPATPQTCAADYATGPEARKNLGKPAE